MQSFKDRHVILTACTEEIQDIQNNIAFKVFKKFMSKHMEGYNSSSLGPEFRLVILCREGFQERSVYESVIQQNAAEKHFAVVSCSLDNPHDIVQKFEMSMVDFLKGSLDNMILCHT